MQSIKKVGYVSYDIPEGVIPDEALLKKISSVREGLFNKPLSDNEVACKFFNQDAYRRRCILFFDKGKEVAGYLCLQSFNLKSPDINVLRCQVALKKHIRGKASILRHTLAYLFSDRRVYTKKSYVMYYMISPLSYYLVMRFSKNELWPSYKDEGNTAGLEWCRKTILGINSDLVERAGVFIHKSNDGYLTEKIAPPKNKHADFFLKKNPGYINGDGLVVIAEITLLGMLSYAIRSLIRKKSKK